MTFVYLFLALIVIGQLALVGWLLWELRLLIREQTSLMFIEEVVSDIKPDPKAKVIELEPPPEKDKFH